MNIDYTNLSHSIITPVSEVNDVVSETQRSPESPMDAEPRTKD